MLSQACNYTLCYVSATISCLHASPVVCCCHIDSHCRLHIHGPLVLHLHRHSMSTEPMDKSCACHAIERQPSKWQRVTNTQTDAGSRAATNMRATLCNRCSRLFVSTYSSCITICCDHLLACRIGIPAGKLYLLYTQHPDKELPQAF